MLPKYVKRVRSKGKDYYYFDTGKRVDGRKVYAKLPSPRDLAFGGSYAALMGHRNRKQVAEVVKVPKLVQLYQLGAQYKDLSKASTKLYDIYLRRLEVLLPAAPVAEITRGDMQRLFDGMADKPGAANAFLSVSSALFSWGKDREYLTRNPCDGIVPNKLGEHAPWPDHVLRAALQAEDDRVRLVTHLLYYTAQRIGDVLRMSWNDIEDGRVAVTQEKTDKKLRIALHKRLEAELAKHPRSGLLICVNDRGLPLKADTTTKRLAAFSENLGHRRVAHGLRKNAVIALLEAGCTMAEAAAISGQSLKMVEHYAKERDQMRLGDAAILKWEGNGR